MCGIVGYVGRAQAAPILLDGLRRLEYRGYDSAGIAVVERGHLETRKCAGRIAALAKRVQKQPVSGSLGVSHTRWATHGKPTDQNAHPHFDASGKLALVHNGVIENYQQIKDELLRDGDDKFTSQTDTEVLAHSIGKIYDRLDGTESKSRLVTAVRTALQQVIGTYGIALVHSDIPNFLVGARRGSPLVLGIGKDENFLASDVSAMVAEYLIEQLANLPTEVEYASEFRHRNTPMTADTLVFAISQSGETADTLGALRESRRKGYRTLGICNNVASTIARESDGGVYMHAGPEIGVAATKSFTSQLVILALIGLLLGRMRNLSAAEGSRIIAALETLPEQIEEVLKLSDQIKAVAKKYADVNGMLFFGRQFNFPIALEGALKMKEITYLFAEGHPSAELKHGIIALVRPDLPSVFIVPDDAVFSKNLNNIEQVKARKGPIISLTSGNGAKQLKEIANEIISLPDAPDCVMPILTVIPLQLLAYHVAVELGRDVDKPRNLAKSVTVE